MYVGRQFDLLFMYLFSWRLILWSLLTGSIAYFTYEYLGWHWVAIPWLPVSLIGTAVAFYVGFKNNQSYERSWEARKTWGNITNLSRSFSSASRAFISAQHSDTTIATSEVETAIQTIIYRHIAWLYALKHSMRQRTQWEHQKKVNKRYRNYFEKQFDFATLEKEMAPFLSDEDERWVRDKKNIPAQLLDRQSQHLAKLKQAGLIDDYRHMELQSFITELYKEQGATERIKNTPLPRQFATTSTIFIIIFTFLLPFGMLSEFHALGDKYLWLLIPFNLVVSWVFTLMEYMGDYSENPFEGLINDVPIYSIVRNIEIDLKDMLGEQNLPEKIQPVRNILF